MLHMDNYQNPIPGSGLYIGPSENDFKPNTSINQATEPVVNSQNDIDLSQYREKLVPTKSTVEKNWDNGFNNSPSLVEAREIKHRTPQEPNLVEVDNLAKPVEIKPDTSAYDLVTGSGYDDPNKPDTNKKPAFDLEFGSDGDDTTKKRDLHQEALDSNKKANEGFVSAPVLSNTGKAFFEREDIYAKNAKLEAEVEELKKQVAELTKKFDDPEALQNALDPNRVKPLNPLEEVQETLLKEQDQNQIDFAKQVQEDILAVTPTPAPIAINPELKETTAMEAAEKANRERNLKRVSIIAGVLGGTAGIVGGAPVAAVGVYACIGVGLLSTGINYIGGKRIDSLNTQISNTTNPELKAKLEKRVTTWEKVRKGTDYATHIARGAGIGFAASGLFSSLAMGGHGAIWNQASSGIPGGAPASGTTSVGTESVTPTGVEQYQGNSFISNGQVHLEGSSWDGSSAGNFGNGTLPGGESNFANYTNGPSGMAVHQLEQDLASNNVTDSLLSNLSVYDKHRLLTDYWNAIRGGNANPELVDTLQKMGTEGARKLLQALGK